MSFPQLRSDVLNPLNTPPGAAAYSILCEVGEYALTGETAGLLASRILAAGEGTYALTGADATLRKSFNIVVDAGTYSLTGADITLRADRLIAAAEGNYSIAGANVDLIYSPLVSNPDLSFNHDWQRGYPRAFHPAHRKPFKFSIPGQYSLGAESGSYSWTGTDTTLTLQQLSTGLIQNRKRGTWPRHFAPSVFGQLRSERTANLFPDEASLQIVAESGSFSWNGQAVTLRPARKIAANSGSFTWTGVAATLNKGFTLIALSGAYNWTGTDTTLQITRKITADSGTFSWAGIAATLRKAHILEASSGSYSWTGTTASLKFGHVLDAESGEFIFLFGDVGLNWSAQPGQGGGRMMLMGVG